MKKINVIYGSTTGTTEQAAKQIAAAFGCEAMNVASAKPDDFQADLLILGASTWGYGELQDDWIIKMEWLEKAGLAGKKVALFGQGDQEGFSDTYVDAIGILADAARAAGAILIGKTSTMGYSYSSSRAEENGELLGLALDDTNEPGKTAARIETWVQQLKTEQF